MDAPVIAAIITGTLAFVGPIVTYFVTKARERSGQASAERLPDREALYEKAAALIRDGRRILDTTWGSDPPELHGREKTAADRYIEAKRGAISSSNTVYREIFTLTNSTRRQLHYDDSKKDLAAHPNYEARVLTGIAPTFPLIDFLIVNGEHVLLSFLSHDGVRQGYQYVYVRSPAIAEHFTEYFDECWRVAVPPMSDVAALPPLPDAAHPHEA